MKTIFTNLLRVRNFILILSLFAGIGLKAQNVPEYMYFKFDAAGNQTNYASSPVGTNPAVLNGLTIGNTGQFGTALIGNGLASGTNNLNTGWATNLPSTGWTISFWLNNFPATASTTYYYFGDASAGSFRCFTGGVAGNGNLWLRGTGFTDVPINAIPSTPTVIHLVYTGTAVRVYFNGVFSSSVAQGAVAFTGTGPFLVGGYSTSNSFNAGTLMDEFRLYNRALTDAEVLATWNQSLPLSAAPICVTAAATGVTSNSATLNGTVNANGANATVSFEYGLTVAYGSTVPGVPATVTGNTVTPVSGAISGLTPNTLYHFRVKAVNANGTTNGSDLTFTTTASPPTVVTTAATGITLNTATLNGTVNANGASSTVTFQYGLTVAYGSTVPGVPSPVTGSTVTPVSAAIAGLLGNTTYHYRVVAVNAGGTTNGNDMTFSTAGPPVVVTNPASNVTNNTAQLNGTVTANNLNTTVSFNWGLTTAYGNVAPGVPVTVTGNTPTAVLANITGLLFNVVYHYQCVGVNAGGTTLGSDQTFQTGCTPPATPSSISGPVNVCQGICNYVYSIAPVTGATSYNWTVPVGGTITSGQGTTSISVCYSPTALYGFVTVAAVGTCGAGNPASIAINVFSPPLPTITGPAITCQGSSNNTYITQFGFTGYVWTCTGGTITSGQGTYSVTVTWNTGGAQSLSVNYNNLNGCPALAPTVYNVTVNPSPVPTITGPNSLCAGSGSSTYTTQAGFTNYVWTVSSGGTINSGQSTNTLVVTWNTAGAQTVSVNFTNTNGCSALTPTVYGVTVNPLPGTPGTITGTSPVCAGANGVAYSVSPVPNAIAYVWTLPTGATIASGSGTNSITVNFAANAASGTITVNGNNLCGNGNPSPPFNVTITPLPDTAGAIGGPASVCKPSTGVEYGVALIPGATSYTWTVPPGVTILGTYNSAVYVEFTDTAVSGNITVMGTNSCGNGAVSPNFAVSVNPIPPAPTISISGNVLSSNAPSGNHWYLDGNSIGGAFGQTYTAVQTGHYWDVVTLSGCSSDTSNNIFYVVVGIGEQNQGASLNVYPNPSTDGMFTLVFSTVAAQSFNLSVLNNLGVTIYSANDIMVKGTEQKTLDLNFAPNGIYSIVLQNNDTHVVKKIIINK
jgi:large repetitive protein